MATIVKVKYGSGAVNAGEERLLEFLKVNLPDNYYIIPNVELANTNPRGQVQYLEYDCLVVTPHAVYNIENKDWGGRLEGDDNMWYLNDSERRNPHKTVGFKSRVLNSLLKAHNPAWGRVWIDSLVTLSNRRQNKSRLYGACLNATHLLDEKLIQYLTSPESVNKTADCVDDIYVAVKHFISGTLSQHTPKERKEIKGYEIIEILQQDKCFTEYLCRAKGIASAQKKRIKEYTLDLTGLNAENRQLREKQIQNQYHALSLIKSNPFILNVQFDFDDENQHFYEITEYLDETSLRSELRRKTFTQDEKLKIIFNIIEALKVAHEANVFHRDLNPENIYLSNGYASLGNFGKSYFQDHNDLGYTVAVTLDEHNATAYHAFELLAKDASRATDIYSLGVLVYELFTNQLPFNSPFELNNMGGRLTADKLPTVINPQLPDWLDELCQHTILRDDAARWDNVEEFEQFLKNSLSQSQVPQKHITYPTSFEELRPGVTVGDYTLYEELGTGGYSRVFKAKHSFQGETFKAIKIFNESINRQTVIDEYKALNGLNHPNIVRFEQNGSLPNGQLYTQMEYLDGKNLHIYTKSELKLPLQRVYQIAKEILDALVYMQNQNPQMLHRDIKPQNIVWDKQERFVLIDFNVASANSVDTNHVGTYPYIAPDLIRSGTKVDWDSSADTFALGITLYELVCSKHPWSRRQPAKGVEPFNPKEFNPLVSDKFAQFLLKAVAYNKTDRFATAQEMLTALLTIGESGILKQEEKTNRLDNFTGNEKGNFVDYLNSLYSQSRYGNAGTRVGYKQSNYDLLTYTKTKLDTKLLNAILNGTFRLVIITGNAGDGKTAFIKQIENQAENVVRLKNRNGARFEINGLTYLSNYDGSQDEEERANNEVLADFFRPFENITNFQSVNQGRIIAINEGRLVDFLQSSGKFSHLSDIIDHYFYNEGHAELPQGLMIINLNLRSIAASEEEGESLFRSQIKKLTRPELWFQCADCALAKQCFIRYNVNTLNDSAAGNEVIKRMEWLVRTVSYKRELHITMRDLRSFIAYMISRDCSCEDVSGLLQEFADNPEKYWQYYYFNITSSDLLQSDDRLIKLMQETDIADVSIPSIDRDLYFGLHSPKEFIDFAERENKILNEFNRYKILLPAHEQDTTLIATLRMRHKSFVRHQYYEGKFKFTKRLPYQSLEDFSGILSGDISKIEIAKRNLAYTISASEGCSDKELSANHLILSSTRMNDPISKSYRRFPLEDFELFVNSTKHLVQYIEYESDNLIFRHKKDKNIRLTVSLELFEMLYFIEQGFSPSVNDLRGKFVELQIFKNLLENKPYKEVIVTKNNNDFFRISLENENKIALSSLK